jgi:uncharacterized protein YecT (DUF1311 family)
LVRIDMRRVVPLLLLLACTGAAQAAEDCAGGETTQAGLNECFGKAYEAADKELNGVYRLVSHRLDGSPDAKRLMVSSQKAWIGFRNAECAFAASGVEGGSARPMVESQCLADLTRRRTTDLKGYLNCEEGDISCPVPKPE